MVLLRRSRLVFFSSAKNGSVATLLPSVATRLINPDGRFAIKPR